MGGGQNFNTMVYHNFLFKYIWQIVLLLVMVARHMFNGSTPLMNPFIFKLIPKCKVASKTLVFAR